MLPCLLLVVVLFVVLVLLTIGSLSYLDIPST